MNKVTLSWPEAKSTICATETTWLELAERRDNLPFGDNVVFMGYFKSDTSADMYVLFTIDGFNEMFAVKTAQ